MTLMHSIDGPFAPFRNRQIKLVITRFSHPCPCHFSFCLETRKKTSSNLPASTWKQCLLLDFFIRAPFILLIATDRMHIRMNQRWNSEHEEEQRILFMRAMSRWSLLRHFLWPRCMPVSYTH